MRRSVNCEKRLLDTPGAASDLPVKLGTDKPVCYSTREVGRHIEIQGIISWIFTANR